MFRRLIAGFKFQDEMTDGGDGGGGMPEGTTMQSLYNQNRMLQRLLQKSSKDIEALKGTVTEFDGVRKQMSGLQSMFGGGTQKEGDDQLSLFDRAMAADSQYREANPESNGIPLTVDMARAITDAKKVIEEQKAVIEELRGKVSSPQYTTEQTAFANLDTIMYDRVSELYGDAKLAEENMQDFERIAVLRMKEIQKDPYKWRRLITNRAEQEKFVNAIIMSKFPKAFLKNSGAQAIEEYSMQHAMADLQRAETIKDPRQRAVLKEKARRRMLPEQLGLTGM